MTYLGHGHGQNKKTKPCDNLNHEPGAPDEWLQVEDMNTHKSENPATVHCGVEESDASEKD